MLSARFGHFLDKPLEPVAKRVRLSPNFLTLMGFVTTSAAAVTIPFNLRLGGLLILIGGAFDVFDGVVARTNGKTSEFGAFLDSVLDRYSDAFIYLALAYYLFKMDDMVGGFLSLGILLGAFMTSYARARGEGLGLKKHVGVAERPERIVLTVVACLTGYLVPFLVVLFILSHLTVIQRVYFAYKNFK